MIGLAFYANPIMVCFPRMQIRGPIEATTWHPPPSFSRKFPRNQIRGPIEAAANSARIQRSAPSFHGIKSVAQLKLSPVPQNRQSRLACFHGCKSVAQLKLVRVQMRRITHPFFHGCKSVAQLKQRPAGRIIAAVVRCFHGCKSVAQLKRAARRARRSRHRRFHGCKSLAQLKHHHICHGLNSLRHFSTDANPWPN